jgi:hypothetical protein
VAIALGGHHGIAYAQSYIRDRALDGAIAVDAEADIARLELKSTPIILAYDQGRTITQSWKGLLTQNEEEAVEVALDQAPPIKTGPSK